MARLHPIVALSAALLLCGCKVSRPNAVERSIVTFTKHHVTVRNRSAKNPVSLNAENLASGREAFGHYCVVCHGTDAQNTGVPFADRMSPPLPPLNSPEVQDYTDGQLKWVIDYGISPSGMPASEGTLNEDEVWSIVLYLRHLPPAGSVGPPEMDRH